MLRAIDCFPLLHLSLSEGKKGKGESKAKKVQEKISVHAGSQIRIIAEGERMKLCESKNALLEGTAHAF